MYTCKQLESCASEGLFCQTQHEVSWLTFTNDHSLTRRIVRVEGRGISFPRLACGIILNVCHSQCRSLQMGE